MSRRISLGELRKKISQIMRALERGSEFTVTRRGVSVAELIPRRRSVFVPVDVVLAAFASAPRVAGARLRRDLAR